MGPVPEGLDQRALALRRAETSVFVGLRNRSFLPAATLVAALVTFASAGWCKAEMTALGSLAITVRKARAELSGVRRPPSQCLTASRLKPKVSEKRDCVMFNRLRIALTSTSAGRVTR